MRCSDYANVACWPVHLVANLAIFINGMSGDI